MDLRVGQASQLLLLLSRSHRVPRTGAGSSSDWGRRREGGGPDHGIHPMTPRGQLNGRVRMAGLEQRGRPAGGISQKSVVLQSGGQTLKTELNLASWCGAGAKTWALPRRLVAASVYLFVKQ